MALSVVKPPILVISGGTETEAVATNWTSALWAEAARESSEAGAEAVMEAMAAATSLLRAAIWDWICGS